MVQYRPAQHIGQEYIQRHRSRMVLARQHESFRAAMRHQNLESLVARKITQYSRIMWIVFDNQQDCIVRLQIVAVVRNLFDRMFRDTGGGQGRWRWGRSL